MGGLLSCEETVCNRILIKSIQKTRTLQIDRSEERNVLVHPTLIWNNYANF